MRSSPKKENRSLILASASPRRKKLVHYFGLPFQVRPSMVDEKINEDLPPLTIAQHLALRKARDIARSHPHALVIGADTIVVHRQNILGKPETREQATEMLHSLSNTTHEVITGVALVKTDLKGQKVNEITFAESTRVSFGDLEEAAIEKYVESGQPMDKAGSYGIQDNWGAIFVKKIEGDYYNIVGLPVHQLYRKLKKVAPELFEQVDFL